jgi:hypothetical protein
MTKICSSKERGSLADEKKKLDMFKNLNIVNLLCFIIRDDIFE